MAKSSSPDYARGCSLLYDQIEGERTLVFYTDITMSYFRNS